MYVYEAKNEYEYKVTLIKQFNPLCAARGFVYSSEYEYLLVFISPACFRHY